MIRADTGPDEAPAGPAAPARTLAEPTYRRACARCLPSEACRLLRARRLLRSTARLDLPAARHASRYPTPRSISRISASRLNGSGGAPSRDSETNTWSSPLQEARGSGAASAPAPAPREASGRRRQARRSARTSANAAPPQVSSSARRGPSPRCPDAASALASFPARRGTAPVPGLTSPRAPARTCLTIPGAVAWGTKLERSLRARSPSRPLCLPGPEGRVWA